MAALQGIKRRIRSVSSTKQITKALQLVSASKLRRAQAAALAPQGYRDAAEEILGHLSAQPQAQRSPLYQVRTPQRGLTILVAGSRGMAGSYNNNVIKEFERHANELGIPQRAICIGKRAAAYIAHVSNVDEVASYDVDATNVDATVAQPVLTQAVDMFLEGQVDTVHLIYTHFVSSVKQEVVRRQLLPVPRAAHSAPLTNAEPDDDDSVLDFATRRALEAQVFVAVLESRASENAARMLAMMNATDNATDLISDLTLALNNARQAGITQELAEITGGADAIAAE
jgi:F-type H+-transporting ATPase subunit gamma